MAVECHSLLAEVPACSSQRSPSTAISSSPVVGDLPSLRRYHPRRCIGGLRFLAAPVDAGASAAAGAPAGVPLAAELPGWLLVLAEVLAAAGAAAGEAAGLAVPAFSAVGAAGALDDDDGALEDAVSAVAALGSGGGGGGREADAGDGTAGVPPPGVLLSRTRSISTLGIGDDLTSRWKSCCRPEEAAPPAGDGAGSADIPGSPDDAGEEDEPAG